MDLVAGIIAIGWIDGERGRVLLLFIQRFVAAADGYICWGRIKMHSADSPFANNHETIIIISSLMVSIRLQQQQNNLF